MSVQVVGTAWNHGVRGPLRMKKTLTKYKHKFYENWISLVDDV